MDEKITDAEFEVVGGPYRVGEQHRKRRGWYFTGRYDAEGEALWMRHPSWWKRRALVRRMGGIPGLIFAAMMLAAGLATVYGLASAGWRHVFPDHLRSPAIAEAPADAPGP